MLYYEEGKLQFSGRQHRYWGLGFIINSDKTKTAKHAHCTSKCSVQTKYHKVLSMESKDNMQFEIKRRQYYFHCIEFVFISVFE